MNKINIQIIPSAEIDPIKWDAKIHTEKNGLIYSTTAYLNSLCDQWKGLVVNDYDMVIAVPYRKKAFIPYCYTPAFIQQLGIIGFCTNVQLLEIINGIKKKYPYGTLPLNYLNTTNSLFEPTIKKNNLLLSLNKSYQDIYKGYRKDLKVNIEKTARQSFDYTKEITFDKAIEQYQFQYNSKMPQINKLAFQRLIQYCESNASLNAFTRAIINKEQEIVAVAVILRDGKRLYNIANTVTPIGRKSFANHFLLHKIIEEFSEQPLLFDFEGSMIPGIEEFYRAFNPDQEVYSLLHYNNLPFPLSLFK